MKIVLNGERPKTWNSFYAGKHWGHRKAEADRVHELVRYAVLEQYPDIEPFQVPVEIKIAVYFKNRPLDVCNVMAKLYIDGLHGLVIKDDAHKYFKRLVVESYIDKDNPRVEMEIHEISKDTDIVGARPGD